MTMRGDPSDLEEREALRARVGDADKVERAAAALIAGDVGPIAEPLVEAGFAIPTIEIDPPEGALDLAPLIALHRYWRARCGPDGAPPPVSVIDLAELRELSEHIGHLRTDGTGYDFVYAAYVPAVARYTGRDWTGWSIGAVSLKFANAHGVLYRALQLACARTRKPIACWHDAPGWLGATSWRRLTVPFAGETGEITEFLAANVPIAFRRRTPEDAAEQLDRVGPRT
ncbi:MAG: hypothetical protein ACKO1J_04360 [Tagaea sp.]